MRAAARDELAWDAGDFIPQGEVGLIGTARALVHRTRKTASWRDRRLWGREGPASASPLTGKGKAVRKANVGQWTTLDTAGCRAAWTW
jgi:hypothetical protein